MKRKLTLVIQVTDTDALKIVAMDSDEVLLTLELPHGGELFVAVEPGYDPTNDNPVGQIAGAMQRVFTDRQAGNPALVSALNLIGDTVRARLVEWGLNLPGQRGLVTGGF